MTFIKNTEDEDKDDDDVNDVNKSSDDEKWVYRVGCMMTKYART